ncbi:MAG: hypothetical protein LBJ11_05955 [Oscillospiraceae bacterium]|jgi:general stress protein CsbA|nr:hypothetical protein [Oscillospiraceae bacterium]
MKLSKKGRKRLQIAMIVFGALGLPVGFLAWRLPVPAAWESAVFRLAGMWCGFGAGVLGAGIGLTLRQRRLTPAERADEEVREEDEREQLIQSKALRVGYFIGIVLQMALVLVLCFLGRTREMWVLFAVVYLQIGAVLLARSIYRKKL